MTNFRTSTPDPDILIDGNNNLEKVHGTSMVGSMQNLGKSHTERTHYFGSAQNLTKEREMVEVRREIEDSNLR